LNHRAWTRRWVWLEKEECPLLEKRRDKVTLSKERGEITVAEKGPFPI